MAPAVYNIRDPKRPLTAVYIGRRNATYSLPQSIWANPFMISNTQTRMDVINAYTYWLFRNPASPLPHIGELTGHDLVCYCCPKPCHGHVVLILANQPARLIQVRDRIQELVSEDYSRSYIYAYIQKEFFGTVAYGTGDEN